MRSPETPDQGPHVKRGLDSIRHTSGVLFGHSVPGTRFPPKPDHYRPRLTSPGFVPGPFKHFTDFQVWVARGEQPLPMKLVITSRDVMSAPQFSVVLREWDLEAELADDKFTFDARGDAQAIEFTVLEPESD